MSSYVGHLRPQDGSSEEPIPLVEERGRRHEQELEEQFSSGRQGRGWARGRSIVPSGNLSATSLNAPMSALVTKNRVKRNDKLTSPRCQDRFLYREYAGNADFSTQEVDG